MAKPLRTATAGTFFVTTSTLMHLRVFQKKETCDLFVETLQHYRNEGKYRLYDFVIMPNHVHLLLMPTGITLERAMQFIKGGFSYRLKSKFPVWQRGYTDHRVRDKADFLARRKYIHQNPVVAGYVQFAEDFPYSLAFRKTPSAAEADSGDGGGGPAEAGPLT